VNIAKALWKLSFFALFVLLGPVFKAWRIQLLRAKLVPTDFGWGDQGQAERKFGKVPGVSGGAAPLSYHKEHDCLLRQP
jgi:hypothetical protein